MCGIFGFSLKDRQIISPNQRLELLRKLFLLSESRGKEACGLAAASEDRITLIKSSQSASVFLNTKGSRDFFDKEILSGSGRLDLIGHSRLVTNGSQQDHRNNQPVIAGQCVGVHNGIVVNDEALWQTNPSLTRQSRLDSEIIFSLLDEQLVSGANITAAAKTVYGKIDGVASIATVLRDLPGVLLATNNGSLYYIADRSEGWMVFASEAWILEQLRGLPWLSAKASLDCCKVEPQQLIWWKADAVSPGPLSPRTITSYPSVNGVRSGSYFTDEISSALVDRVQQRYPHDPVWAESLRRCTACILPETMPFIRFDTRGVCNYCHNYHKIELKGENALRRQANRFRSVHPGKPDCVVGVSGGRDSLYALHYIKKVLGMNPVAYTYDWGMVTDLARRNISRVCSRLGIEHIIVSADIRAKRDHIRQNVTAWLRKPHLGVIPLFMAGDKQYFYYLKKVSRQVGVPLTVMGENMLERTDFKTGFAGVSPYRQDREHVYSLSGWGHLKLLSFYMGQYLTHPGYINGSLVDTAFAAMSYYMLDRNYLNIYAYIPWEEREIISLLRQTYDFELAPDTSSTWRIGDGTAAFYNYIYYKVAGFTENDTFRSNQIREGKISREEAWTLVRQENKPRYHTIAWYLQTINLDIEQALAAIDRIPRLKLENI
jgi:glutamine---fructose-6-phosphate transaminase (isomerizing)